MVRLLDKPVEIEVSGHKAKILSLSVALDSQSVREARLILWRHKGKQGQPPGDRLAAWIEFDQSVEGVKATAVLVPLRVYGKDEFLEAVTKQAEKDLAGVIQEQFLDREAERRKEQREKEADHVIDEIRQVLSQ